MNVRNLVAETALGPLTLVADHDRVTGLYLRHHIRRPDAATFGPRVDDDALLGVTPGDSGNTGSTGVSRKASSA